MQPGGAGGSVIDLAEDLSAVDQKLPSRRGQRDAAVGSGQQSGTDLLLKQLDLLAERRLGNIQPGCRMTKM